MQIKVVKTAGFCFGVQRAVDIIEQYLKQGEKISTLGEIIHNPQVVAGFEERGVIMIDNVADNPLGYTVVLRSHGVALSIFEELWEHRASFLDATCPFVSKIHQLVLKATKEGKKILLAGDKTHPEVVGILGYSKDPRDCLVFSDFSEYQTLLQNGAILPEKSYILIAQTTFNLSQWQKCVEITENVYTNIIIFDTICNATMLRQTQSQELAKESDMMIVIGGRESSNTTKLAQICEKFCPTFHIETADEVKNLSFEGVKSVGVTAGASTPAFIIKEVLKTMSEIFDMQDEQDEQSFEEMLEASLKTINSRDKVTATVTSVSPTEIAVDIGTKHAGYVPFDEYTDDHSVKLEDVVKVGDQIELVVLRVSDIDGTATLSKKRLDAIAGFDKLVEAEQSGEILQGMVIDVVKGGVIALTNGVRVFIPASQATVSRNQELESLLKHSVSFKILETNRQRRRAVGSIRAVLKEQRKGLEDKFWEDAAVGTEYEGVVKSLTSYGVFVDLGGVDGMVHISELSWKRIKHPSEVVSLDDVVKVYVKDLDIEKKKISLGYKRTEDNPWETLKQKYNVGDTTEVTIVSLTPFGAFAQVIPGVDGLIHISQISVERVTNPADVLSAGQTVQARITEIDYDKKRVSLSIRALMEKEEQEQEAAPPITYEAAPPQTEKLDEQQV